MRRTGGGRGGRLAPGRYSPGVADALELLKVRAAQIVDLERIGRILSWDQQTMMPAAGATTRAEHMATLRRLQHGLLVDAEMGRLLDELVPLAESPDDDSDDAALIRLVRREYDKAVRVPVDLRAEMARSAARARTVWVKARAESDFASFLPALEHNFDLRLRYIDCFDEFDEPYDILLDDFEPETTTAEVRAIFEELKPELQALISDAR